MAARNGTSASVKGGMDGTGGGLALQFLLPRPAVECANPPSEAGDRMAGATIEARKFRIGCRMAGATCFSSSFSVLSSGACSHSSVASPQPMFFRLKRLKPPLQGVLDGTA